MRIASEYAKRLGIGNLRDGALDRLVQGYPGHGFVIDKKEASELFKEVEEPDADLLALGEATRGWPLPSPEEPLLYYLTTPNLFEEDKAEDKIDAKHTNQGTSDDSDTDTQATGT